MQLIIFRQPKLFHVTKYCTFCGHGILARMSIFQIQLGDKNRTPDCKNPDTLLAVLVEKGL